MKKILITFLVTGSLYAYNGGINIGGIDMDNTGLNIIKGSGKIVQKRFNLENCNKIKIDASIDIIIEKSSKSEYIITTDDNLINVIGVENRAGTLVVSSKQSYQTNSNPKIVIKVKQLNNLTVEGGANIKLKNLNETYLTINIDGAIEMKTLSGNVNTLNINVDGAYDVDLSNLKAKNATVIMRGSGDLKVNVSQKLDARVSDNGYLLYTGTPLIVKDVTDNGYIEKN